MIFFKVFLSVSTINLLIIMIPNHYLIHLHQYFILNLFFIFLYFENFNVNFIIIFFLQNLIINVFLISH